MLFCTQNTLFVQNNGHFTHFSHVILYVIAYNHGSGSDIIRYVI